MLEYELKKKLQEDSLLNNLFRTKQTHEMNHIDLYLELRALEDKYKQIVTIVTEEEKSRQIAKECQQEMEEQEEFHMKNIEKIGEELSIKEE